MNYWLLKSEPTSYSIDDLKRDGKTVWTGVRNFQARNFLRAMKKGDRAFFYHSSADVIGIYGIAEVVREAYEDPTAKDKKDSHYDPKGDWACVDVKFLEKFDKPFALDEIKKDLALRDMKVVQRGSRLSVSPVTDKEWKRILSKIAR